MPTDEPRLKPLPIRQYLALGLLVVAVGLLFSGVVAMERRGGRFGPIIGPSWAIVFPSVAGIVAAIGVVVQNSVRKVQVGDWLMPITVLIGGFGFTLPRHGVDREPWVIGVGLVALAVLVCFVLPMAVLTWRRAHDERDNAILAIASTVTLFVTVTVIVAFALVDAFTADAAVLTPGWTLLTIGVTWLGSFYVVQRAM